MTTPDPSTEARLAGLESSVAGLSVAVGSLIEQAAQLRDRHTLLEQQMTAGLADLQRALDAVNARRPPVRRKLQEVEDRLDQAGIPPAETMEVPTA